MFSYCKVGLLPSNKTFFTNISVQYFYHTKWHSTKWISEFLINYIHIKMILFQGTKISQKISVLTARSVLWLMQYIQLLMPCIIWSIITVQIRLVCHWAPVKTCIIFLRVSRPYCRHFSIIFQNYLQGKNSMRSWKVPHHLLMNK